MMPRLRFQADVVDVFPEALKREEDFPRTGKASNVASETHAAIADQIRLERYNFVLYFRLYSVKRSVVYVDIYPAMPNRCLRIYKSRLVSCLAECSQEQAN